MGLKDIDQSGYEKRSAGVKITGEGVKTNKTYCTGCGNELKPPDSFCGKCGRRAGLEEIKVAIPRKNPTIAGILAMLLVGAGQVYNGQIWKGFGLFVLAIILWMISPILGFFVLVYAVYDAYSTAVKMNQAQGAPKPIGFGGFIITLIWAILVVMVTGIVLWQIGIFGTPNGQYDTTTQETTKPSTTVEKVIDFNAIENQWCDTHLTDLQRQDMFDTKYKDKYITWTGEVASVSETWSSLMIQVKHCPQSFSADITVTMRDDQRDKLLKLQEGDRVTYKAKLTRFGTIVGLYADDGVVLG